MAEARVRVAVAGARGKMGTVTVRALGAADGIDFVGGLVHGAHTGDDEFADLAKLVRDRSPDVIVDFSRMPDSKAIALAAIGLGVRPVIGTSGYTAADIAELRAACERTKTGCVFAPNFGIGAVLMMRFAEDAARHYQTVEIVEMHESGKKDAPSGTAMATARRLAAAGRFGRDATKNVVAEGARGAEMNGIGIHSLRLPGVVAHQEVIFGGSGETLRITHESTSRESFMNGVLIAVRKAKGLTSFVDGLETLL